MRTTHYTLAAIVATFGLATSWVSAETKRVIKGRAGYTYVTVSEQRQERVKQASEQRAKTIGLFVGDARKGDKRRAKAGGRGKVGLRKTPGK